MVPRVAQHEAPQGARHASYHLRDRLPHLRHARVVPHNLEDCHHGHDTGDACAHQRRDEEDLQKAPHGRHRVGEPVPWEGLPPCSATQVGEEPVTPSHCSSLTTTSGSRLRRRIRLPIWPILFQICARDGLNFGLICGRVLPRASLLRLSHDEQERQRVPQPDVGHRYDSQQGHDEHRHLRSPRDHDGDERHDGRQPSPQDWHHRAPLRAIGC
mmetsp:Transcript_92404/g.198076  ORF Transcript_92404/g.198076 Transcript_92404/m.198076 type:complete len:213 (+) Transcript_92404:1205-1843(+)